MRLIEQPEGILLTMPVRFFKDYPGGETQFRNILQQMNKYDTIIWGQTISNIPTIDILYVYLVFSGFVQYRRILKTNC